MHNGKYLLNTWYVAALSSELEREKLFARTLLDTPVVMYRQRDGAAVALHDRCPHRFSPLSMGHRDGDNVVCPYHGLRFNTAGQCVHNPHGNGTIPAAAKVRTFPLIERYGFIWIWMGDAPADASALPDYGPLDRGHPNGVGHTYMRRPCHYELITDNVMDLSHVDHLHGEIISTRGQLSPKIPKLQEADGEISVHWQWEQTPPIMIFNAFLPEPGASARHFVRVAWRAPTHIQLTIGATQDPSAPLTHDTCTSQYDLHTCTPETDSTTHYFFATRRNHFEEDADYNRMKITGMHDAFVDEDGPVLDAVQKRMGTPDLFSLNPVLISSDGGPVRVRRILKRMIEAERAASSAEPRVSGAA
jgi:phenylpropionate dioxygenase-like ring-hydroxylating dioxygenase large terminal subunit